VIAVPGGRRTILAKTEASVVEPPPVEDTIIPGGGMVGDVDDLHLAYKQKREELILREDEEIIEIISIIAASGILEE
jgi:hypothetical protein